MPAELLTQLRAHLATAGIVRVPSVAGSAPPMWLERRDGVPAPGEGSVPVEIGPTAVLGASVSGGIPPRPYESWQRRPIVDIRLRTENALIAHQLDAQIRGALIDRRNWMLGSLRIIESQVWREFQPLGADQQSFDYVTAFVFQLYDGDGSTNP